jgi:hypothetical protein
VGWLVLHIRTSVRVAVEDTWQVLGSRAITGVAVTSIALVVAYVATRQSVALWTIFGYAVLFVVAFLYFLVRHLAGWNRIWRRESRIDSQAGGRSLYLSLNFKGRAGLRLGATDEFTCEVRDSAGSKFQANHTGGGGSMIYCVYPADFESVPALRQGTYSVIWLKRKQRGVGKWRAMDVSRIMLQ